MHDMNIAALIMAAGESSRFRGCKHLAMIDGAPMLQGVVNQVHGMVAKTYAVTGAWHNEIEEAVLGGELRGLQLIHNHAWRRGLGHSIAVGVAALASKFDGVMILLADQVAIQREDIEALLSQFDGQSIVCGVYADRRGVPAVFGAPHLSLLQKLDGDWGARLLLNSGELPIIECPMPRAAIDIDTRQGLENWRAQL